MRNLFINSLEMVAHILALILVIGVILFAGMVLFEGFLGVQGLLPALGVLICGLIVVIMTIGMIYLFLGIHRNTKRTAEAVEALQNK